MKTNHNGKILNEIEDYIENLITNKYCGDVFSFPHYPTHIEIYDHIRAILDRRKDIKK